MYIAYACTQQIQNKNSISTSANDGTPAPSDIEGRRSIETDEEKEQVRLNLYCTESYHQS